MIIEIVILAMIAAFLGLRLYSVLGRRAEHEEEHVPPRFERDQNARPVPPAALPVQPAQPRSTSQPQADPLAPQTDHGIRAIANADRSFDLLSFIEGARGAYAMVLDAFWRGDREDLAQLCDADVLEQFTTAIEAREAAGEVMESRLVRIEEVSIRSAEMAGRTARITLLFRADIASVTRDRDGNVVAGSLDDAIESRDLWTFRRDLDAAGPDWLLDETDED